MRVQVLMWLAASILAILAAPAAAQEPPVAPATSAHDAAVSDARADDGRALLERLGCHRLDGRAGPGPSFADRYGGLTAVRTPGSDGTLGPARPVPYDRGYLTRALLAPDAELADGYPAGVMPTYRLDDTQIDAIAAALAAVATEAPEVPSTTWLWLWLGVGLFVGGHFVLSSGPIRGRLVARLGAGPFSGLYSVVAFAGLGLMVHGAGVAPYVELWPRWTWTNAVPLYVMPLVMVLWVFGFGSKNPAAVMQGERAAEAPSGITTVTRHPALWGFVIWALAHLPPNGDLAWVVFFGGFAALAAGGMWHIERRRMRDLGAVWQQYRAQTSIVPFAAVISGRTRLRFGWGDLARLVVAVVLYVGMLHSHRLLFSVPALVP